MTLLLPTRHQMKYKMFWIKRLLSFINLKSVGTMLKQMSSKLTLKNSKRISNRKNFNKSSITINQKRKMFKKIIKMKLTVLSNFGTKNFQISIAKKIKLNKNSFKDIRSSYSKQNQRFSLNFPTKWKNHQNAWISVKLRSKWSNKKSTLKLTKYNSKFYKWKRKKKIFLRSKNK